MVNPLTANGRDSFSGMLLSGLVVATAVLGSAVSAEAAPPRIRTDANNAVPRCVTPKRLMAFIKTRNTNLEPRFADIAALYKKHGEAWRVRWDYAFFQMVVETNFLTYRKGDGDWGDVNPKQNNFAGLGTTGGGVPGDSYPDPSTGVLAQIQHLVVYSGERIDNPVGARTRLKQDDIIETMASKKGQTTFSDLSRRWAADRHYGASIEWVASKFRETYCTGPEPAEETTAPPARKAPIKKVAAAKQDIAAAANLGGPKPAEQQGETNGAPVRTIWSAADGATAPDARAQPATEQPPAAPSARVAKPAPLPTRKPAENSAPENVVVEQVIQTGDADPPVAADDQPAPQAASVAPSAPQASPAAAAAEKPSAFAYAAAMGGLLPKPGTPATAGSAGCRVTAASYGGKKVLLVRAGSGAELRFTVLTVHEGFEKSMLDSYLKAHAPGGESVGEFASKDAALAKAKELCPSAAAAPGEGASAG